MDQAVGQVGVKALLNKIKEQYKDSHVQLPDGTVPKGKVKLSTPKATKVNGITHPGNTAATTIHIACGDESAGQGVKAKLAEINSKYADSFVMLPDGSIPVTSTQCFKNSCEKSNQSNHRPVRGNDIENSEQRSNTDISSSASFDSRFDVCLDYESIPSTLSNLNLKVVDIDKDCFSQGKSPMIQPSNSLPQPSDRIDQLATSILSAPDPPRLKTDICSLRSRIIIERQYEFPSADSRGPRLKTVYGVGISFKVDPQGYLEVQIFLHYLTWLSSKIGFNCAQVVKISDGSPGAKSAQIYPGDKLIKINNQETATVPAEDIPELISGPLGSSVELTILRQQSLRWEKVQVTLIRGPCDCPRDGSPLGPRTLTPKVIAAKPIPIIERESECTLLSYRAEPHDSGRMQHHGLYSSTSITIGKPQHNLQQFTHQTFSGQVQGSPRAQISSPGTAMRSKRVGVGLVFNDEVGRFRVKHIVEGSPAQMSGVVREGDELVEIDGKHISGKASDYIQEAITGALNSSVILGFMRHSNDIHSTLFRVRLARVWDSSALQSRIFSMDNRLSTPVPTRLVDKLLMGDDEASRNYHFLRMERVSSIINAAKECPCIFEKEFAYTHFNFEDSPTETIARGFDQVSSIISRNMRRGLTTFVHCSKSLSRSSALCTAYLMKEKHATLSQAFSLVKRLRPHSKINHSFYLQLVDYEFTLFGSTSMRKLSSEEYARISCNGP